MLPTEAPRPAVALVPAGDVAAMPVPTEVLLAVDVDAAAALPSDAAASKVCDMLILEAAADAERLSKSRRRQSGEKSAGDEELLHISPLFCL